MSPIRTLVIARWYPAIDDPVRGSFVADQVDALVATGRIEATVASFEFVRLNRVAERRESEREAVAGRAATAVHERSDALTLGGTPAVTGTWPHLVSVPVARLPVPTGPEDTPTREADDHLAAIVPFIEGLAARSGGSPPFDLVHAHTGFPDGVLAAAVARSLGVPFLITEHSSRTAELLGDPDVRRRYAASVRQAAKVVVVSEALAAELRAGLRDVAGLLDERLVVVPNAVPVERFAPGAHGERRPGELLYVGTRKAGKGIATLLEAFALARRERPDLSLRLIGRSPTDADEARWHARAVELDVADAVSFEPPADRSGVAAAMARADVFVHASRRETFGVVLVEALASGLPVVATKSGGADGILGPDTTTRGMLVGVDDPAAMADAILRTLARRPTFDAASMHADAEARFGASAVADQLLAIYEEIAASGVAGRVAGGVAGGARVSGPPASGPPASGSASGEPRAQAGQGAGGGAGKEQLRPHPLPVIVGFNRVQAARQLGALPVELLAGLTLVTVEDPGDQPLPAGIGTVVAVDLDADHRAAVAAAHPVPAKGLLGRIARRTRDPHASARIAAVQADRPRYRLETARRHVAEVARRPARSEDADGLRDLLCIDGYDVLAAATALDSGLARLAPGGTRWLADRWAAQTRGSAGNPARD